MQLGLVRLVLRQTHQNELLQLVDCEAFDDLL
jgi:hypothetical protein